MLESRIDTEHHTYYRLEPRWLHHRCLRRAAIPEGLADWLFERGSMTQRVRDVTQDAFEVRVLVQHWALPSRSEAAVLGLQSRERAVIREIELVSDGRPLVSARSVFPERTLRGKGNLLHVLGNRPLVDVLQSDPTLSRSDFEIAALRPGHRDYARAVSHMTERPPVLWARRSIFYLFGRPLLVSEVFLKGSDPA